MGSPRPGHRGLGHLGQSVLLVAAILAGNNPLPAHSISPACVEAKLDQSSIILPTYIAGSGTGDASYRAIPINDFIKFAEYEDDLPRTNGPSQREAEGFRPSERYFGDTTISKIQGISSGDILRGAPPTFPIPPAVGPVIEDNAYIKELAPTTSASNFESKLTTHTKPPKALTTEVTKKLQGTTKNIAPLQSSKPVEIILTTKTLRPSFQPFIPTTQISGINFSNLPELSPSKNTKFSNSLLDFHFQPTQSNFVQEKPFKPATSYDLNLPSAPGFDAPFQDSPHIQQSQPSTLHSVQQQAFATALADFNTQPEFIATELRTPDNYLFSIQPSNLPIQQQTTSGHSRISSQVATNTWEPNGPQTPEREQGYTQQSHGLLPQPEQTYKWEHSDSQHLQLPHTQQAYQVQQNLVQPFPEQQLGSQRQQLETVHSELTHSQPFQAQQPIYTVHLNDRSGSHSSAAFSSHQPPFPPQPPPPQRPPPPHHTLLPHRAPPPHYPPPPHHIRHPHHTPPSHHSQPPSPSPSRQPNPPNLLTAQNNFISSLPPLPPALQHHVSPSVQQSHPPQSHPTSLQPHQQPHPQPHQPAAQRAHGLPLPSSSSSSSSSAPYTPHGYQYQYNVNGGNYGPAFTKQEESDGYTTKVGSGSCSLYSPG